MIFDVFFFLTNIFLLGIFTYGLFYIAITLAFNMQINVPEEIYLLGYDLITCMIR